jgi:fructose-1,6-bisphosphatase/inositol monophosphatase family enzyme
MMSIDHRPLLNHILALHQSIRDAVVAACEQQAIEELSDIAAEEETGDTIYAIDRVSEEVLLDFFAREIAPHWSLVLVAEGLPGGEKTLPEGTSPDDAELRIIVDPIDGTRGLMYQKRSAWVLTGVAPNRGAATSLHDIELAVQTEIPLVKQHLSDVLWATRAVRGCPHPWVGGGSTHALRHNRITGEDMPITLRPSRASTIAHGFAMISRFFPGARDELAALDEAIVQRVLGPPQPGKAHCFEDQYICSAGQMYELIAGHDRFVADLRPLLDRKLAAQGKALGICCHPYDLAAVLVAQQAGVIITDEYGKPVNAPLTTEADVTWVGYANEEIRSQISPVLYDELCRRGLLGEAG